MRRKVQGLLCGWLLALPIAGCHSNSRPASIVQSGPVKQYAVKGIIVGTDSAHGEVTVDSEVIPGFMDAMTMPYKVKDTNVLQDLHPGDHMTGRLLVAEVGGSSHQGRLLAHIGHDAEQRLPCQHAMQCRAEA